MRTLKELDALLGDGRQRMLARQTGYSHSHMSRVLSGKCGHTSTFDSKLMEVTGVTIEELWAYISGH